MSILIIGNVCVTDLSRTKKKLFNLMINSESKFIDTELPIGDQTSKVRELHLKFFREPRTFIAEDNGMKVAGVRFRINRLEVFLNYTVVYSTASRSA